MCVCVFVLLFIHQTHGCMNIIFKSHGDLIKYECVCVGVLLRVCASVRGCEGLRVCVGLCLCLFTRPMVIHGYNFQKSWRSI